MRTYPDISLMTAMQQACSRFTTTCAFLGVQVLCTSNLNLRPPPRGILCMRVKFKAADEFSLQSFLFLMFRKVKVMEKHDRIFRFVRKIRSSGKQP